MIASLGLLEVFVPFHRVSLCRFWGCISFGVEGLRVSNSGFQTSPSLWLRSASPSCLLNGFGFRASSLVIAAERASREPESK